MLSRKKKRELQQKEQEERMKELYRLKIISEYTDLCKILESDLSSKEKIRAFVLYDLEHGGLELEHSFEGSQELQIGVDGLKNYKFSVLYQIISAAVREEELRVANPLAAAKMITSMMAGWALVRRDINFDCYPEEGAADLREADEGLAQTIFDLISPIGGYHVTTANTGNQGENTGGCGNGGADRADGSAHQHPLLSWNPGSGDGGSGIPERDL